VPGRLASRSVGGLRQHDRQTGWFSNREFAHFQEEQAPPIWRRPTRLIETRSLVGGWREKAKEENCTLSVGGLGEGSLFGRSGGEKPGGPSKKQPVNQRGEKSFRSARSIKKSKALGANMQQLNQPISSKQKEKDIWVLEPQEVLRAVRKRKIASRETEGKLEKAFKTAAGRAPKPKMTTEREHNKNEARDRQDSKKLGAKPI